MSEVTTTLASFNVDKEAWEEFKALAAKEGRSASYGLNELIKQALQRKSISGIDTHSQSIPDIDLSGFVGKGDFEKAIANLTQEIEKVKKLELPA